MLGIITRGSSKQHKIRSLKTNTGENYSITLTKEAYDKFSGCKLYETILSDGVLLTSGCAQIVEHKFTKIKRWEVI